MNLAPIRYARVLTGERGPIERIEYGRIEVAGRLMYQANAYLSRHLNLKRPRRQIHGDADGTGTHGTVILARYKAISEAMERWAYHYLGQIRQERLYGSEWDSTTSGMSAYPGLFRRQAQGLARREAMERYCLASWWTGHLGGREIKPGLCNARGIELENPLGREHVVVLWQQSKQGFHAYGFGAGPTMERACWRAMIELHRSMNVLEHFYRENPGIAEDDLEIIENHMERRMFYFSMPSGHRAFLQRVEESKGTCSSRAVEPVFDRELKGPWQRYAIVWRVIYPSQTREHLLPYLNTFFW
jgi:ribosomal protein S12 methylthiotransferase accessory factor YcaO